jgi:RNA polymerase sigma-70 factor (ECF subfamily)
MSVEGTDAPIVQRVLAGETEAYAILVARHRDRCLRYARRMLGDQDEAEDVTQETFVRGYRSLARCEAPERFGAWLFTILVNRVRTTASRRTTRERYVITDHSALEQTLAAGALPDDMIGPSIEEVERAVARLDAKQREAFILKYVDERTYDEMTQMTGVSVSALKMRVSRACDFLRAQLEGAYNAR